MAPKPLYGLLHSKTFKAVFVLLPLFFGALLDSFQHQQNTLCYYIYLEVQTYLKCLAFMDMRPCVVGWSTPAVPKGGLAQDQLVVCTLDQFPRLRPTVLDKSLTYMGSNSWNQSRIGWIRKKKKNPGWSAEMKFFFFLLTPILMLSTLYEPQTFVNAQIFFEVIFLKSSNGFLFDFKEYDRMWKLDHTVLDLSNLSKTKDNDMICWSLHCHFLPYISVNSLVLYVSHYSCAYLQLFIL